MLFDQLVVILEGSPYLLYNYPEDVKTKLLIIIGDGEDLVEQISQQYKIKYTVWVNTTDKSILKPFIDKFEQAP